MEFNLEKFQKGVPVVTRSGKAVSQLTVFETAGGRTLYGVVDGLVHAWWPGGSYSMTGETELDLCHPEEERIAYVFKNEDGAEYAFVDRVMTQGHEVPEEHLGHDFVGAFKLVKI